MIEYKPIALTITDAIKQTGLSRTRLYEAMKEGAIVAKKAGRRTLIAYADLETYLASLPFYQAGRALEDAHSRRQPGSKEGQVNG